MRPHITGIRLAAGLAVAFGATALAAAPAPAQETRIVESAVTLSSGGDRAELWIDLSDGTEHRLSFDDGVIRVDGSRIGSYDRRSPLVDAWRELVRELAGAEASAVRSGLLGLRERLAGWDASADRAAARDLGSRLDQILGLEGAARTEAVDTGTDRLGIQIVPGGDGFDFTAQLERLRASLARLGDVAPSLEEGLAMVVHDDVRIPAGRSVDGNLALLGGRLDLAGEVEGHVLVLDGRLVLAEGARIGGDVLQVGGDLDLEAPRAVIEGEILSDFPVAPAEAEAVEAPAAPEARAEVRERSSERRTRDSRGPFHRFARNLGHAVEGLLSAFSTFVGLGVLGLLLVYFARERLETVSDTVRHEFARSFAMGLAGQVLFFPALLILVVLVITWPIVPFFVLGCALAALAGYVAVAHAAGEMFARSRYRYEWLERIRRSNSYYYVLSGLVLLLLPFAAGALLWVLGGAVDAVRGLVLFVACVGTWVLVTTGFGSMLLTRAGSRSVVVDWSSSGHEAGEDDHVGFDPAPPADEPGPPGGEAGTGDPEAGADETKSEDA